MKPIYVAFTKESGTKGWLLNPKLYRNGRLCLMFMASGPVAAVETDLFKPGLGSKEFIVALQDELDRLGISWADLKHSRFGVKAIDGKPCELFLVDFSLTGPLPWKVAKHIDGKIAKRPVKIMSRFGG